LFFLFLKKVLLYPKDQVYKQQSVWRKYAGMELLGQSADSAVQQQSSANRRTEQGEWAPNSQLHYAIDIFMPGKNGACQGGI